jgi:hypothetical protein
VLGIQVPIVMGIGMLLLGAVLMLSAWRCVRGSSHAAPKPPRRTRS